MKRESRKTKSWVFQLFFSIFSYNDLEVQEIIGTKFNIPIKGCDYGRLLCIK